MTKFGSALSFALVGLIAACDSGPGDSDFIAACMKEGEIGANKALRREMGVKSEDFCKCAAAQAKASLSADARQAMILDMQGKQAQARAISAKMNDAEQMAFMKGGMAIFEKCARPGR
jgi:hypothetical protein